MLFIAAVLNEVEFKHIDDGGRRHHIGSRDQGAITFMVVAAQPVWEPSRWLHLFFFSNAFNHKTP